MQEELVEITFNKIMQTRTFTIIILGNAQKKFAIYADPSVGKNVQKYLTQNGYPRPLTHDLINSILLGLDAKVLQIVINDVKDSVYFAKVFLEQQNQGLKTIVEIDARPSDSITLALLHNAPIYCKKGVLENAVPID